MPQPAADSAGVRFPPPLIFLGGLIIGLILQFKFSLPFIPWRIGMVAGAVVLVAGVALVLCAVLLFKRAGTALPPWETATTVVVRGPYHLTRNPMYLGMALIQAGIGLWFTSVWILLMLIPELWWIRNKVILREEAYMREKFGKPYQDYCDKVRRWL